MKTIREIKRYRRNCERLNRELQELGILNGSPCVTAFLSALDWVLMPSEEKEELYICPICKKPKALKDLLYRIEHQQICEECYKIKFPFKRI